MALTTLDPKTALIVVDLQKGFAEMPTVHPFAGVVKNTSALAAAFRARGLPVVLVVADGSSQGRTEQASRVAQRPEGWTDVLPELNQQREDHVVTKRTWGAFRNTELEEYLRRRDVTQVVITGVATSRGVESTARAAHECGFNVTLALDAMTDLSAEAHANSVSQIFPRLGETGTTRDVLALLEKAQV